MFVLAPSVARAERDSTTVAPTTALVPFPSPEVRRWQVGLLRPDRLEHASASFVATTILVLATRDTRTAAGIGLAAGLAKEWYDHKGPSGFDRVDLAADALGVAAAVALVPARPR
ncbi:MAG: hypothetical protein ACKO3S_02930 [bacterium]